MATTTINMIIHMKRHINRAYKVCDLSDHAEQPMACVVVKGGVILAAESNRKQLHAEERALRKKYNFENATLIVVRKNGRVSKPCNKCLQKIIDARIKAIVYVDIFGSLVKERVDQAMIDRVNPRLAQDKSRHFVYV